MLDSKGWLQKFDMATFVCPHLPVSNLQRRKQAPIVSNAHDYCSILTSDVAFSYLLVHFTCDLPIERDALLPVVDTLDTLHLRVEEDGSDVT